ncbi:hypothetical protein BT96DRAFT_1020588 [Gymnopus androsaceus JB14]|uniref:C2H2-type domain-containing protein n=1 Tax=Gymnopus androsaceus JB14 TaxID=1447944 RepID=A0A6A4HK17_9AGAR|nr:hypothetical protein BT96DRAFT_1020588 [Gymnopus androsaceus JB14]
MPRATSLKLINQSACQCNECGVVIAHRHDMRRHMRTHGVGMAQVKYQCSWPDCSFEALQKSNLNTHYRTHSQDKSKACPEESTTTCPSQGRLERRRKIVQRNLLPHHPSDISSPTSSKPSFDSTLDFPSLPESSTIDPIPEPVGKPFFPDGPPSNLDDLFFEPDFVHRRQDPESNWDEIRRSPEPRPLSPAVEIRTFSPSPKSPNLPFDYAPADRWSKPLPIYGRASIDIHHSQVSVQQLQPTPFDSALRRMAELNRTIPVTIPETDFREIFSPDYENFLEQFARPMPPWSS